RLRPAPSARAQPRHFPTRHLPGGIHLCAASVLVGCDAAVRPFVRLLIPMRLSVGNWVGHFPWFFTNNWLHQNLPKPETTPQKLMRNACNDRLPLSRDLCDAVVTDAGGLDRACSYRVLCERYIRYVLQLHSRH